MSAAVAVTCLTAAAPAEKAPARPGPASVVVVLSSQAAPYRLVAKALSDEFNRAGITPEFLPLDGLSDAKAPLRPKARVFVGIGTPAAVWLHTRIGKGRHVVFCMVADPDGVGLSSRPGRAGVRADVRLEAQWRLIAEALPGVRCVGMLYRRSSDRARRLLSGARQSLPAGWRLAAVDMDEHRTAASAIEAVLAQGVDIVWTVPVKAVYDTPTVRCLLLGAMRRRIPVFGFSPAFVRAGAVLGVGIDVDRQGRRAARLACQALASTGSKAAASAPGRHGWAEPHIAVNLAVARKLSVTLPREFVARAKYVYGTK